MHVLSKNKKKISKHFCIFFFFFFFQFLQLRKNVCITWACFRNEAKDETDNKTILLTISEIKNMLAHSKRGRQTVASGIHYSTNILQTN